MQTDYETLTRRIAGMHPVIRFGRISAVLPGSVSVVGLSGHARLGDAVEIKGPDGRDMGGEIIALTRDRATVMVFGNEIACGVGDRDPVTLPRSPSL